MNEARKCPECGSQALYITKIGAPVLTANLIPGVGRLLGYPKLDAIVCSNCGLTRFYAEASARAKLQQSKSWRSL